GPAPAVPLHRQEAAVRAIGVAQAGPVRLDDLFQLAGFPAIAGDCRTQADLAREPLIGDDLTGCALHRLPGAEPVQGGPHAAILADPLSGIAFSMASNSLRTRSSCWLKLVSRLASRFSNRWNRSSTTRWSSLSRMSLTPARMVDLGLERIQHLGQRLPHVGE